MQLWTINTPIREHCTSTTMQDNLLVLLPPWQKEVMFFGSVSLSACLFVFCGQHYSESYERTGMKSNAGVPGGTLKN